MSAYNGLKFVNPRLRSVFFNISLVSPSQKTPLVFIIPQEVFFVQYYYFYRLGLKFRSLFLLKTEHTNNIIYA